MTGIPPFAYGYSVEETNRDVRDLAGAVEASSPLPVTSAPLLLRSLNQTCLRRSSKQRKQTSGAWWYIIFQRDATVGYQLLQVLPLLLRVAIWFGEFR